MSRTFRESPSTGTLSTPLPTDLLSLLEIQQEVLDNRYPELWQYCMEQIVHHASHSFLWHDTDLACATANDFWLLADRLEEEAAVTACSRTAVQAAERAGSLTMRQLYRSPWYTEWFRTSWEDSYTDNQVCKEILSMVDEHWNRVQVFLSTDFLRHKALVASVRGLMCCFVRRLVETASERRRRFEDRALRRMRDDIALIQGYFKDLGGDERIMTRELRILDLVFECMSAPDLESLEQFVVVLHKHTGSDTLVTRCFVGDLWSLMHHEERLEVRNTINQLEDDLMMVSRHSRVEDTSMSELLRSMYEDRLAHEMLPVCYNCIPKDEDDQIVGLKIRKATRAISEMTRKFHLRRKHVAK